MATKKERLATFNRNNILEAAESLFAEKGLDKTSMDDVAKGADCSKSTIYVYFRSKEEIRDSIILMHMEGLRDALKGFISRHEKFEECYFGICRLLVETHEKHALYFDGMMGRIRTDAEALAENRVLARIYEVGEEINDSLILLFEKGKNEGYLRHELEILPTVHTLWASLSNTIVLADNKEAYYIKRMGMTKLEFMEYGFHLLLFAIRKEGVYAR